MRIPAGDLAPARRRRYGGTYGRRRRRTGRALLALVAVGLAGGGAYLLQRDDSAVPSRITAARPCVTPRASTPTTSPTASRPVLRLPAPGSFEVLLLNGTPRGGLGKSVGDQLAALTFRVRVIGNAPPLTGASVVSYGAGAMPSATLVSRTVLGARALSAPRLPKGQVRLVLGSGYVRLRTAAELAELALPTTAAAPPAAAPAPTSGACRSASSTSLP